MTKSMGALLKMMQGGTDRTGFADMADEYAFTPKAATPSFEDVLASIPKKNTGIDAPETDSTEEGDFNFGSMFDFEDNAPEALLNSATATGILGLLPKTTRGVAGKLLNVLLPFEGGLMKAQEVGSNIDEIEELTGEDSEFANTYQDMNFGQMGAGEAGKYSGLNLSNLFSKPSQEELDAIKKPTYREDFNKLKGMFGFADGGRVGMQQGGAPGGMSMPALLGVSSGSSGNLFNNYTPNPSAVPGPNYGTTAAPNYSTYQTPSLTSLFSPYSGNQFGNIGDSLGGPDPYAVGYNPYVDMGGSAYDQYGMGMTQEDIDKVFADVDKFSLAAQEAKRKAAEEAAKKKAVKERDGGQGGGGDRGHNNPGGSTSGSTSASPGSSGTGFGGSSSGGPPGTGAEAARDGGNPGGYNEGGSVQNLLLSLLGNNR